MKGKTNQNLDDLKKLENLIGQKMFGKMARCFAGKELYFPKILLIAEKHQAIRNEYRKGMTVNTLTAKYGYTGTYIRQIVQNEEGKPERMTFQQGVKKLLKVFKKVM
jgi:Mor family transcriptional regulator